MEHIEKEMTETKTKLSIERNDTDDIHSLNEEGPDENTQSERIDHDMNDDVDALALYMDKVTPPFWHIIDSSKLKVGDHIYRRLKGWNKFLGYHHGVVTFVSNTTQNEHQSVASESEKPYWSYLSSSMIDDTQQEVKAERSLLEISLHKYGMYGHWSTTPYACAIDSTGHFIVHNSTHFKQVLSQTHLPLKDCGVDINYNSKQITIKYFKSNDEVFPFSFRYPFVDDTNTWTTFVNVLQQRSGSCKQELLLNIKVIEMTADHGIREVSLSTFLDGDDCRLVYYNTYKMYERFHAAGTCHYEPSAPLSEILKRAQIARLRFLNDSQLYDLFTCPCHISYHIMAFISVLFITLAIECIVSDCEFPKKVKGWFCASFGLYSCCLGTILVNVKMHLLVLYFCHLDMLCWFKLTRNAWHWLRIFADIWRTFMSSFISHKASSEPDLLAAFCCCVSCFIW
eukprot:1103673_1